MAINISNQLCVIMKSQSHGRLTRGLSALALALNRMAFLISELQGIVGITLQAHAHMDLIKFQSSKETSKVIQ